MDQRTTRMPCGETPVITPRKGKNDPDLGPVAVMVATRPDINGLCQRVLPDGRTTGRDLFTSRVYTGGEQGDNPFSVTGPFIGAPAAVMLLETLIAWGARKILFFGWCGAICPSVKIGDILLPSGAVIDEGTSRHYGADHSAMTLPSGDVADTVRDVLKSQDVEYAEHPVWTTDAAFMETGEKMAQFRSKGAVAVEMEMSALFAVARFRQVHLAGLMVVSDDLSSGTWRHGFRDSRFKQGRKTAHRVLEHACRVLGHRTG